MKKWAECVTWRGSWNIAFVVCDSEIFSFYLPLQPMPILRAWQNPPWGSSWDQVLLWESWEHLLLHAYVGVLGWREPVSSHSRLKSCVWHSVWPLSGLQAVLLTLSIGTRKANQMSPYILVICLKLQPLVTSRCQHQSLPRTGTSPALMTNQPQDYKHWLLTQMQQHLWFVPQNLLAIHIFQ